MNLFQKNRFLAPLLIGGIVFAASMATTELAWNFNHNRIDRQIRQIGEIYLDGLVASVRTSQEKNLPGDVDRRLRAAMFEQNGIKERVILVFDAEGKLTNTAGDKALVTDAIRNLDPGGSTVDFDTQTIVASRRLGDGKSRATVALDVGFVFNNYNYTQRVTIGMNLAVAILSGLLAALLQFASSAKATVADPKRTADLAASPQA
jgi:hypothetical protein